jgi:transposase
MKFPHAERIRSVARSVVDGAMLHLIKMWLEAPVEETDDRGNKHLSTRNRDKGRGTPQGSPRMQEVIRGLQALHSIAQISAVTIASELSEVSRFEGARQLMAYSGTIPSENSSGKRTRRGSITKTGNAHLKRQEKVAEEIKEIAWKAQHRLHKRYSRLAAAGKDQRKVVTALGRELLGFIWAIGVKAEAATKKRIAA